MSQQRFFRLNVPEMGKYLLVSPSERRCAFMPRGFSSRISADIFVGKDQTERTRQQKQEVFQTIQLEDLLEVGDFWHYLSENISLEFEKTASLRV